MDQSTFDFFLNQPVQINLIGFIQSLIAASILCFVIQLFYVKFSNSLSNKNDFSKNFIGLGLATTIVITVVKSSLALSLGLVGALSIVRFRAAIKEPEELVYLFLVIATGLGCGADQIKITFIGVVVAIILIYLNYLFQKKNNLETETINSTFTFNKRKSDKEINEIIEKIMRSCENLKFVSISSTENETVLNLDIKFKDHRNITKTIDSIKKDNRSVKIILAKNSMLTL